MKPTFRSLFVLACVTAAVPAQWTRVNPVTTTRAANIDRSYGPAQINGRTVLSATSRFATADYLLGTERRTASSSYASGSLAQYVSLFGAGASLTASAWGQIQNGQARPNFLLGGYSYIPGTTVNGLAEIRVNGNVAWSQNLTVSRSLDAPPIARELTRQRHTEYIPIGGVVNIPVTVEVAVEARLGFPASITFDLAAQRVQLNGGINPYLFGTGSVTIGWEQANVGIRSDLRLCNATLGVQLYASPTGPGGRLVATFQPVSLQIVVFGGVTITIRIPLPFGLSLSRRETFGFERELFRWSAPTWSTSRVLM